MDDQHKHFKVGPMQTAQTLAQLTDWRDEITLVPYSGTQMLDFGFQLDRL